MTLLAVVQDLYPSIEEKAASLGPSLVFNHPFTTEASASALEAAADPSGESRLMTEARRRLARGDVVRELLCAGVSIDAIEHLLRMGEVHRHDARRRAETGAPHETPDDRATRERRH